MRVREHQSQLEGIPLVAPVGAGHCPPFARSANMQPRPCACTWQKGGARP